MSQGFDEAWLAAYVRKRSLAGDDSHIGPQERAKMISARLDEQLGPLTKSNKYRNKRMTYDGIAFQSKKECTRYIALCALKAAGEVKWFLMQCPFRLPGGTRYYCDFLVVWADGRITVEDCKSEATRKLQPFRIKRREILHHFGVEITEI